MEQLIKIKLENKPIDKAYALISFDDGYLDNFETAFPLLKKHALTATFFITTNFVSQTSIPWWDEIAWMIKNTQSDHLCVGPNNETLFSLNNRNNNKLIHQILTKIKTDKSRSMKQKVGCISKQLNCQYEINNTNNPLFMNWDQVREMKSNGMSIGGHTLSHPILAHLNQEEQFKELSLSKKIIEKEINQPVNCFAYPVGAFYCFNQTTKNLLEQLAYQLAFVYETGFNAAINNSNQFELLRFPIEENRSCHRLKYTVTYAEDYPENINHKV